MMDQHVSVALLFFFLTGGYSLKCYSCTSALMGFCEEEVQICPHGYSKCAALKQVTDSTITTKMCALLCYPGTSRLPTGETVTVQCCDTDLCNAADGVYKGSFLLLLSLLLFCFLFQ